MACCGGNAWRRRRPGLSVWSVPAVSVQFDSQPSTRLTSLMITAAVAWMSRALAAANKVAISISTT